MAAHKGNKHWLLRLDLSKDGRKLSVEEVRVKSMEYIKHCIETPILDLDFRGKDSNPVHLEKPRAMTKQGLCVYLGIDTTTWDLWRKDEKYIDITTRVEGIMFAYDFEEAAANRLNSNIIARKLGLVDKKEQTIKGVDLGQAYEEKYKD